MGSAILGSNQREVEELPAAEGGADRQARAAVTQIVHILRADGDGFIHGQMRVQHYHGGHQLAYGGNRSLDVNVFSIQRLSIVLIKHQNGQCIESWFAQRSAEGCR